MKNFFSHIIVLMVILALSSCKKDPLPVLPEQNDPYYTIKGLMNNDSIDYSVGLENVSIIHGITELNGVDSYYGELYAPNDDFKFRIEIIKPEITNNASGFNPLQDGEYDYLYHNSGCVLFKFGLIADQINYFLVKDEMDQFVIMDQIDFEEFGIYEKTVKFTDITSGQDIFKVPVKYGFEDEDLVSGFSSYGNMDTVIITPNVEYGEHKWFIDGDLVGEEMIYSGHMADGVHEVRHVIKDEFGNEQEDQTLIRFRAGEFYWQMTYNYCSPLNVPNNYCHIKLTVEHNNQTYCSTKAMNEEFEMEDLFYVANQNNEIIWAIYDFELDATLVDENWGDSLSLSEIKGTFNIGL